MQMAKREYSWLPETPKQLPHETKSNETKGNDQNEKKRFERENGAAGK